MRAARPDQSAGMSVSAITHRVEDEVETGRLAARLAPMLHPGDTILLNGPLGAGKTHFARALIRTRLAAVGLAEDVPSPTFTLVQTYDDGDTEIWHCDLYRLFGPDDVAELGLEEAFDRAICLVEWPDRLGAEAPDRALTLTFAHTELPAARDLRFDCPTDAWRARVRRALAEASDA